jgi:hypothetical protein
MQTTQMVWQCLKPAGGSRYATRLFLCVWRNNSRLFFLQSFLTQTLIVHMIRTEKIPFFQSVAVSFLCSFFVHTFYINRTNSVQARDPNDHHSHCVWLDPLQCSAIEHRFWVR